MKQKYDILGPIPRWCELMVVFVAYMVLVMPFGCDVAGLGVKGKVDAPVKVDAPLIEASAEVNAALLQKVTKLEAKIGELESQVGGNRAGGNIWNIGTGGAGMAAMLLLYVLADRRPTTRAIKDWLKGKTCPK